MYGLILKDFYAIGKMRRMLLPMVAFFLIMSFFAGDISFAAGYVMIMASMMPITSISLDAKSKWDAYAISMPVSRLKIVLAKYLFSLLIIACGTALLFVLSMIGTAFGLKGFYASHTGGVYLFCTVLGILASMIILPIMYKFGAEKGRYAILAIFLVPAAFVAVFTNTSIGKALSSFPWQTFIISHQNILIVSGIILLVILYMLSFILSAHFYRKKDF